VREPRPAQRALPSREATTKGIDGRIYHRHIEDELNTLAARVLGTPDGNRFLSYLRGLTLNVAFPGSVATNELLHMEGQRYIVGLMMARTKAGEGR
jgi:hypothetical protein